MYELGTRPCSFISGNICFESSVQCLCSVQQVANSSGYIRSLSPLEKRSYQTYNSCFLQCKFVLIVVKIKLTIAMFIRPLISRHAVWFSPVRSSPAWRISIPGMARPHMALRCTVILFVWVSAKFSPCTVVDYSRPGRGSLATSRLGTGKLITLFYTLLSVSCELVLNLALAPLWV